MSNVLENLLQKIPGATTRTVVKAKFVDGKQTVATVRAMTPDGLREKLSTAIDYLSDEPYPNGVVVFEANTIVGIPILGDVRLGTRPLGTSAEGGYRKAINLLTPQSKT